MYYYNENEQLAYFPATWTDAGQTDPFVALAEGRAVSRFDDLLRLDKLIEDLKQKRCKGN